MTVSFWPGWDIAITWYVQARTRSWLLVRFPYCRTFLPCFSYSSWTSQSVHCLAPVAIWGSDRELQKRVCPRLCRSPCPRVHSHQLKMITHTVQLILSIAVWCVGLVVFLLGAACPLVWCLQRSMLRQLLGVERGETTIDHTKCRFSGCMVKHRIHDMSELMGSSCSWVK